MALLKTFRHPSGLVATDAYHRIIEMRLGERRQVSVTTVVYVSQAARQSSNDALGSTSFRFVYNPNEQIIDSQSQPTSLAAWAYSKLKTLEEFSGAVDA